MASYRLSLCNMNSTHTTRTMANAKFVEKRNHRVPWDAAVSVRQSSRWPSSESTIRSACMYLNGHPAERERCLVFGL